ncbi:G-type lectin S-receptor-like serine/threonine-protein kinase LECRK3 [Cryptomeria japonica]|uniref:G-type lectin S-receptor-like serine/threonine-protein kinase LECRK3 n=1 Tax=Cryptomeria japonica TaxID=3369 RepID=UPI0027DAAEF9|nr:G-type lectin S-receptor-like serine/threonine-protein kinase LECRK3 [Cryptomeria japonica]
MAALLDSGNFVLINPTEGNVWQSFDFLTDTLLPGQMLKWKSVMYSKASATNYSSGRFELVLQEDGNLVLYPVERVGEEQGAYWSSGTYKYSDNPINLIFDESGELYLKNDTRIENITDGETEGGRFLRRVTLNSDGILGMYIWNADGDTSWYPLWQSVTDPCSEVKGQCGRNGICQISSLNQPLCVCPPGFHFTDKEDHFRGCSPNSPPGQSCSASAVMYKLDKTDWTTEGNHLTDLSNDYMVLDNTTETECKKACMDDCMCTVVTFEDRLCHKKRLPLIDGYQELSVSAITFVKVKEEDSSPPISNQAPLPRLPNEVSKKGKVDQRLVIGISLMGCSSALVAASILIIWLCWCGRVKLADADEEGLAAFSYKDIEFATGGFREEIGSGAFGRVYKGTLTDSSAIAVKTLDKLLPDGLADKQFRTEMSVIGMSHHKNLVQIYGFCDQDAHKLLVYEYVTNGSLDRALFVDRGFLSWRTRVQIATGTARGILYLHEECTEQVVHCDIKPQNILLDDNYNPKISDFGLAKLMKAEQTRTFTGARGTKGYVAPEWHKNIAITVKVDVYSFGVMLLEIICCRKTINLDAPENEMFLSQWVYECLKHNSLDKLVEKQRSEGIVIDSTQLERMVLVGLWSIQENPSLRPSMKKVVQMLEGTVEIALPPSPDSFISLL